MLQKKHVEGKLSGMFSFWALKKNENVKSEMTAHFYGRNGTETALLCHCCLEHCCVSASVFRGDGFGSELLVFSATPFRISQNEKSKPFNRLSPESGKGRTVNMERLSPRFRSQHFFLMQDMQRSFFFTEICMETPCWWEPKETSLTEFCYNAWIYLWKTGTEKRDNNTSLQELFR